MKLLSRAIARAAIGYYDGLDRNGKPYILHCLYVMNNLHSEDEDLLCAAVLHDCVEDEVCTLEDLRQEGFSERTCMLVNLLTHKEEDSYDDYIKKLSINKDAILIKLSDLEHNSQITRLKGLKERDLERMQKYHHSYLFLKAKLHFFYD